MESHEPYTKPIVNPEGESSSYSSELDDYVNENLIQNVYQMAVEEESNPVSRRSTLKLKYHQNKRHWAARTFAQLTPGSLRGSILTLISTSMGAGVLTLPFAFVQAGWVVGVICIIVAGLIAGWMLDVLVQASFRTKSTQFNEVVEKSLSAKQGVFFQWFFIIYIFGTVFNLQIISTSFVTDFFANRIFVMEEFAQKAEKTSIERAILVLIINAVVVFPISCAKNMYKLRHVTIVIVGAVVYTLTIIIIQSYSYIHNNFSGPGHQRGETIVYWCFQPTFFSAFAVMIFAYNCNTNLFPIRTELTNPIERRMIKICDRTIAADIIIYSVFSVIAYFSFLSGTPSVVTKRNPLEPGSNDILMNIARVIFCFSTMFSIPIRAHPCRMQVMIYYGKNQNPSNLWHYGLTVIIVVGAALVCIVLPDVYTAFTIIGGYGSTMMAVTYPGILFLKNAHPEEGSKKVVTWIFTVIGTLLGFTAATLTVLNIFGVYTPTGCTGSYV